MGSDLGITANGIEGRHVKRGSHRSTSANDPALATPLAAVSAERSQADEAGNLPTVEPSKFGQFCDQRTADGRPNTLDAPQHAGLSLPSGIGFQQGVELLLHGVDLLFQDSENDPQAFFDLGRLRMLTAV